MIWVTRARPKTDRIACPWLIRRFIDPDAEIRYVPAGEVLGTAERDGGRSFDAPVAEYTHRDGRCSFEVLIEEFDLGHDPGMWRVARIVHAADIVDDLHTDAPRAGPARSRRWWSGRRDRRSPAPGAGQVRLRRPLRLVPPGLGGPATG